MSFANDVYALCTKIPRGKVTTYKELAHALGIQGYQAVGQALRRNPYAPNVPCHRVVSSTGHVHGFKGKKNACALQEKILLLKKEGVYVVNRSVDLTKYLHHFSRIKECQ